MGLGEGRGSGEKKEVSYCVLCALTEASPEFGGRRRERGQRLVGGDSDEALA